jgi:hypothetical protein
MWRKDDRHMSERHQNLKGNRKNGSWLRTTFATLILVALAALILAALLMLRGELGIEPTSLVEPSWLVLAFLPVVIWLLATGRLEQFTLGSVTAKLASDVAQEPVTPDFASCEVALSAGVEVKSQTPGDYP